MELLHAYATDRLAKISEVFSAGGWNNVRGTVLQFQLGANGWGTIADASGIKTSANRDVWLVNFTDAVDPAITESYWATVGFLITADNAGAHLNAMGSIYLDQTALLEPQKYFAAAGSTTAYVEVAYNPITKDVRIYSNGIQVYTGTWTGTRYTVSMMNNVGYAYNYTIKDIYVARFRGDETPRLRRWKSVTLPPVTNNIGAGIAMTDGTMVSVGETKLEATYNIPAKALGVTVQSTMINPDNASDLSVTISDGTTTTTKKSGDMSTTLPVVGNPVTGHSVVVGSMIPANGASTFTVGVKAEARP